jgi:two-component system, NtrC family, sensor histidine kinase GlrK
MILLGWVLIALPLLFAIAFSSITLNRLTVRSEAAIQHAGQAARLGWELEEDLGAMERTLRQYEVLRDPTLLEDYTSVRGEWRQHINEFANVSLLNPLSAQASGMQNREETAYLKFAGGDPDAKPLLAILGQLKGETLSLRSEATRLSDEERQAFHAEMGVLYQQLGIALAVSLLIAAALFWYGQHLLTRLLDSVGRAVIALGNNLLERRIRIQGPDDLRWLGKRLDWLRRRMLALEEERTRVLQHISHELKTPLAALREGSSLLTEGVAGSLSPQQARIAGIMQGNTLRLQGLIDGLLKLQQAEHARERIEPVALRLDDMIQHALATHKLAARNKRLRITGTLAPLTIMGGHEEVTTIINNLLSNAIKFSPEHGTVRILLARDNKNAVIDVIDEGPGIPAADRTKIFQPFYRSPGAKSVAGVGLGLAIAHEFTLAQRGSLDILAAPAGAHFRATLPLAGEGA